MALSRIVTAVDLFGADPDRPLVSLARVGGGKWQAHPAIDPAKRETGAKDIYDTYEDAAAAAEALDVGAPVARGLVSARPNRDARDAVVAAWSTYGQDDKPTPAKRAAKKATT